MALSLYRESLIKDKDIRVEKADLAMRARAKEGPA